MNVFTFSGRLGSDAEVRYTASGTAVCSFVVANDTGYGDNKKTQWIDCVLFGKRAEGGLPQHLTKGAHVVVSGEVTLNTYAKRDGSQGASLQVRVNDVDLIGRKGEQRQQREPAQQPASEPAADFDDDIPF